MQTFEHATTFSARRRHLAVLTRSGVLTDGAGLSMYRLGASLCHERVGDQAWINDAWATASKVPQIEELPACKPCVKANLKREADRG